MKLTEHVDETRNEIIKDIEKLQKVIDPRLDNFKKNVIDLLLSKTKPTPEHAIGLLLDGMIDIVQLSELHLLKMKKIEFDLEALLNRSKSIFE